MELGVAVGQGEDFAIERDGRPASRVRVIEHQDLKRVPKFRTRANVAAPFQFREQWRELQTMSLLLAWNCR
jgi:hypothetical protein